MSHRHHVLLLLTLCCCWTGRAQAQLPVTNGLVAHWVGDQVEVEDGDRVVTLLDQSGNGYAAKDGQWWDAGAPDYRPQLVPGGLNGHDVVRFDGTTYMHYYADDDELNPDWNSNAYTWFIVMNADHPLANPSFYNAQDILCTSYRDCDPGTAGDQFCTRAWGSYCYYGNTLASYVTTPTVWTNAEEKFWHASSQEIVGWRVMTGVWDPAVTVEGDIDAYNNSQKGPAGADTNATTGVSGHIGTHLGRMSYWNSGNLRFFTGDIAEVIIYKRGLTTGERNQVEDYLYSKYGMAAPSPGDILVQWRADDAVTLAGDPTKVEYIPNSGGNSAYRLNMGEWWATEDHACTLDPNALNDHHVITFDGLTQYMMWWNSSDTNIPEWVSARNYTWAVVYQLDPCSTADRHTMLNVGYDNVQDDPNLGSSFAWDAWGLRDLGGDTQAYAPSQYAVLKTEELCTDYDWNIAIGVWDPCVTVEGDVDNTIDGTKGSSAFGDTGTTSKVASHKGTHVGARNWWLVQQGTDALFQGAIAEIIIYQRGLTPAEIDQLGGYLAAKYGLGYPETPECAAPDCYSWAELAALAAEWLVTGQTITWEDDMSVDPVADGDWTVRGGADAYTISGGLMNIGPGAWSTVIDTVPDNDFVGTTQVELQWRATSVTSTNARSGVGLFVLVNHDQPMYGNLFFSAVKTSAVSQVVEIYESGTSTTTPLATIGPFNTSLLSLTATIDGPGHTITYSITDGTTVAADVLAFEDNSASSPDYHFATIATASAAGEVDYVKLVAQDPPLMDLAGDDHVVNLPDFGVLSAGWCDGN